MLKVFLFAVFFLFIAGITTHYYKHHNEHQIRATAESYFIIEDEK